VAPHAQVGDHLGSRRGQRRDHGPGRRPDGGGLALTRRILACGGRQLYYPGLTRYLFSLARSRRPKVLLIPTASGDSAAYQLTFYQQLAGFDCEPSHLTLFDRTVADIDALIKAQDIVMVSGGNTANMLAIWRVHGVDRALRAAYALGTVLTGWSAGCICWFEGGTTDSFTPELGPLHDGLGILKGSASPHYDSEERRRTVYQHEIAAGLPAGIALEDGVAAVYEDERLVEVVTGREGGRAFAVDRSGERAIATRLLPAG
jgi:peptidase E